MDYHRAALMLIRLIGAVYALMGVVWMISSLVLIVATAFGPTLVLHLVGGSYVSIHSYLGALSRPFQSRKNPGRNAWVGEV